MLPMGLSGIGASIISRQQAMACRKAAIQLPAAGCGFRTTILAMDATMDQNRREDMASITTTLQLQRSTCRISRCRHQQVSKRCGRRRKTRAGKIVPDGNIPAGVNARSGQSHRSLIASEFSREVAQGKARRPMPVKRGRGPSSPRITAEPVSNRPGIRQRTAGFDAFRASLLSSRSVNQRHCLVLGEHLFSSHLR